MEGGTLVWSSLVWSRTMTSDESAYRQEMAVRTTWSWTCSRLWRYWIVGERPTPSPLSPSWTIEYLMWITDLKWSSHQSVWNKAQQRLHSLQQFRKFHLPQELMVIFYTAVIQSVLCTSIIVWFGLATKQDRARLQRTIREDPQAENISADPGHKLFYFYKNQPPLSHDSGHMHIVLHNLHYSKLILKVHPGRSMFSLFISLIHAQLQLVIVCIVS